MKKGDKLIYIGDIFNVKYETLKKGREYTVDKVVSDNYITLKESIVVHNISEFISVH
jgi:hypothetical protein